MSKINRHAPVKEKPILVIDAKDAILGRLASFAAKQALFGKKVIIVNCNEAIVSGKRANIIAEYRIMRQRGGSSLNGPNFPKHADRLVKRTVRGMMYFRHGRGKDAFKDLRCYNAVPAEYEAIKRPMKTKELMTGSIKLSELAKLL